MNPPYSLRAITDLGPGHHLCCLYETEEEHRAVLTPFLRQGLERDEKVLYIVDSHRAETVRTYLREDGVEVDRFLERGQLSILTIHDAYMRDGIFDPDEMIGLLRTETKRALEEGYSALRVTGEMTWALRGLPGSDRLIEYEAKLNTFFPGSRCLAICQYDRRRFPPALIHSVLRTHPVAILGVTVCPNLYYEPPDLALAQEAETKRVDWMIASLQRAHAADEALARSERQFRELVQSLDAIIWEADAETWQFSFVSRQAETILGYPVEQWRTEPDFWANHIHPEDREKTVTFCRLATTEGRDHDFGYRALAADGRVVCLRDIVRVVKDEAGRATHLRGVMVDITEHKRTQDALAARTHQLEAVRGVTVEITRELNLHTLLGLIIRRATGLVSASAGAVFLWDDAAQVLVPQAWHGLGEWLGGIRLRLGEGTPGAVAQLRKGLIINDYRISRYTHPLILERTGIIAVLAEPMLHRDRLVGVITLGSEETGRRFTEDDRELLALFAAQAAIAIENARLYEELRTALERIEASQQRIIQTERLRALGEMASGVSHDFNNILSIILGRAQLLLTQTKEAAIQRQLEVIKTAAMDGARTVQRVLEFSRVKPARPFEAVDLRPVIQEVLEITRPLWKDEAQAKGISYTVRGDPTPLPTVTGDPSELREALTNLVFNALDAMPAGGRLTFRTGVKATRVYCEVSDTGTGMSAEVKQRVFDPYFTTKGEGGSGLGLSVVYGIITRHGGEIEVQSQAGRGSTFTIWLPVARANVQPQKVGHPSPHPRKAKILAIDDEPQVRELLTDVLVGQGHSVVACADGASGITRFQKERFDLVITDLSMPGLSGWEVVRTVKSQSPQTPIVMITGFADSVDPEDARAKGVEYLVAKPFRIEHVQEVVALALSRQGHRDRGT